MFIERSYRTERGSLLSKRAMFEYERGSNLLEKTCASSYQSAAAPRRSGSRVDDGLHHSSRLRPSFARFRHVLTLREGEICEFLLMVMCSGCLDAPAMFDLVMNNSLARLGLGRNVRHRLSPMGAFGNTSKTDTNNQS